MRSRSSAKSAAAMRSISMICSRYTAGSVDPQSAMTLIIAQLNKLNLSRSADNAPRIYRDSQFDGWRAGFELGGTKYFKYFSDQKYGGSSASRKAAEAFALENKDLHDELLALRRRFVPRANSRSGIPGVSRYDGDSAHGPFWLAYWDHPERKRRVSKRFSVAEHGDSTAFRLAKKARELALKREHERYQRILKSLGLVAASEEELIDR